jgi:hypothetical protein
MQVHFLKVLSESHDVYQLVSKHVSQKLKQLLSRTIPLSSRIEDSMVLKADPVKIALFEDQLAGLSLECVTDRLGQRRVCNLARVKGPESSDLVRHANPFAWRDPVIRGHQARRALFGYADVTKLSAGEGFRSGCQSLHLSSPAAALESL